MSAFPIDALAVRFRYALNADLTALPSTWTWVDFTTDVDFTFDIDSVIGATDDASETNSSLGFYVRNNDGKYTIDHPESTLWPYWREGVPIEYAWDLGDGTGWRVQQIAYLGASDIEWTANTPYRCVSLITAAGPFRRLGVDPDLASALRRTIPSSRRRKAFWPLEDSAGALHASSYYPAVPPMVPSGTASPEFGTASLVPGAFRVATFNPGANLSANLPTPTTSSTLRLSCLLYAATIPAVNTELLELRAAGGTIGRYVVEIGAGTIRFRAYTNAGVEVSGGGFIGFTAHESNMVYFEVDITQTVPGTISWTLRETTWRFDINGLPVGSTGVGTSTFSGTLGGATAAGVAPTSALDSIQIGMLALTEGPLPSSGGFAAVLGWAGNTATARVQGMCNEFGVPSVVTSTTLGSVMGPQVPGSLLANLRDVFGTDHGVLTDHLGAVAYTALSELYNLAPVLTLSALTRGQLGRMAPRRDDQTKANIASASRPGGSTATVADDDDVRLSGRFERSPIEVNVAADTALPSHAGWALAIGTQRGYDFRQLELRPHLAPSLAGAMVAATLGSRIAITALPPQMPKGGLERIVRGRTTKLPGRAPRRVIEIKLELVPTDVYDAFILDSDRLDTAGCEVIAAAGSADTALAVQFAEPAATVTGATSIPLWAAGEQVTLTAVANETLTDAYTRVTAAGLGSVPATATVPALPWTSTVSAGTGSAADFATTGAAATFTMQAAGTTLRAALNSLPLLNPDQYFSASIPVTPTGEGIFMTVQYRRGAGGGTDAYEVHVLAPTSGPTIARLYAPGFVLLAEVPLSVAHSPGLVYLWRVAPVGTRHRAKVWTGSLAAEPSYWMIDVQDTARVVPGPAGMRAGRGGANTNAGTVVCTWDNWTLAGVQRLTVTRGVGGFSKALPIGSQVRLWRGRGMGI